MKLMLVRRVLGDEGWAAAWAVTRARLYAPAVESRLPNVLYGIIDVVIGSLLLGIGLFYALLNCSPLYM